MTSHDHLLGRRDLDAAAALVAAAQAAQSDPAGLLPLHTHDAIIVNLAGRRVLGRDAFGEAMAAALASPLADVRTEVMINDVRAPTPDVMVLSCTKTIHDERAGHGGHAALPMAGALTYVLVRVARDWRIALAQTTPILSA